MTRRFLTLADVAEMLNVSASQAYALVRSGDLRAIKIGGRGQWRIEESELERFITERYEQTEQFIAEHPFTRADHAEADEAGVDENSVNEGSVNEGSAPSARS